MAKQIQKMKIRFYIGLLILLAQIGSLIYSRFIPERLFCWAPYDTSVWYEVKVLIDNKELTPNEVTKRYNYDFGYWENRSIENVFFFIERHENTYGLNDNANVTVKYRRNGKPEKVWSFVK